MNRAKREAVASSPTSNVGDTQRRWEATEKWLEDAVADITSAWETKGYGQAKAVLRNLLRVAVPGPPPAAPEDESRRALEQISVELTKLYTEGWRGPTARIQQIVSAALSTPVAPPGPEPEEAIGNPEIAQAGAAELALEQGGTEYTTPEKPGAGPDA